MKIISIVMLFVAIASYGLCSESKKSRHQFIYMDQNFEEFNLISKKMKTEKQCHDETKYKQEAVWIAAKEECQTIPGKKVCTKLFGVKICNKLPAKTICKTIPGHKEYKQVPYLVSVCTPVETLARKFKANVLFDFKETQLKPEVKIMTEMDTSGKINITIEDHSWKPVVLLSEGEREVIKDGKITNIFQTYRIKTINQVKLLSPVVEKPTNLLFAENGIHFITGRIYFPGKTFIRLRIENTKNGRVLIDRIIEKDLYFIEKIEEKKSRVIFNLAKLGLNLRNKEYKVRVVVGIDTKEKILNSDLPTLKTRKTKKMIYKF